MCGLSHTEKYCDHLAEEGVGLSWGSSQKNHQFVRQRRVNSPFQQILPPPALILQQNINKYSDAFKASMFQILLKKLTIEKGETVCTGVSRKDFLKITVLRERNGNKKLHSRISGNGIFQWEGKFEAAIKIWFKRTIPHYNINIYQHIISYHFLHSPRLGFLIPLLWRVD